MSELVDDLERTILDLSLKVRESVLASNAHAGVDWAAALESACAAYDYVNETENR
jgi:hypothetical protein